MKKMYFLLSVFLLCFSTLFALAPSNYFDLSQFKLQYPGPSEQESLTNYTSKYFFSSTPNTMSFYIDATLTGHTQNSDFVRSELRNLSNWYVSGSSSMSATISVDSSLIPSKITVMQIHGETKNLQNAPPLLRIALNNGSLYAMLKTSMSDEGTKAILLEKNMGSTPFNCKISVQNSQLKIWINNELKVEEDISYWHYMNYFKIGAYPQAHKGYATVNVSNLIIEN